MYHFYDKNNNLTSRICNKSDKSFILDIYERTIFNQVREFYEVDLEMFNNRFDADYHTIEMILHNNKPIGFYQIDFDRTIISIQRLFLHPDYHKQSIGKKIMKSIINWGIDHNYDEIRLMVWENNPALSFYKNFGFIELEKIKHKYSLQLLIKSELT